jgi:hypothetical protein
MTSDSMKETVTGDIKSPPMEDRAVNLVKTVEPSPAVSGKQEEFKAKYYSTGARAARITGSSFAIAWSIALLIFFNYFSQYIAYYHVENFGGVAVWQRDTLITPEFSVWLPILTATLVISIIGHVILLAFDKYILRQIVQIVLDAFGAATAVSLFFLYPFNFSVIPDFHVAQGVAIGLSVVLIIMAVGFGIGALARLIRLIVNLAEGKY